MSAEERPQRMAASLIDVSEAIGTDIPLEAVATVVLPEADTLCHAPVVAFAIPGAGYNRTYFTFDMPGASDGGEAGWHARQGWIFVAVDLPGVGEASVADPGALDLVRMTTAYQMVVTNIIGKLASGDLVAGFPAIEDPVVLGLGQSMGGGLTVVQQAHHATFDGICILGFSAVSTTARGYPGGAPLATAFLTRDRVPQGSIYAHGVRQSVAVNAALLALGSDPSRHVHKMAPPPAWNYHYDDVPAEIVTRDLTLGDDLPPWRSRSVPGTVFWLLGPGAVAPEAAAVMVPVLSAFGERDVAEDPRMEHRAFRHAVDFSSFTCPRMGHMHNFASTREILWSRIHHWGEHVADLKRQLPENWPALLFSNGQ